MSGQFFQPSRCLDARPVSDLGGLDDHRRMVDGKFAIECLDASRVRMFKGERTKARTHLRNCGDIAGVAPVVDDRGDHTVQGQRAILWDGESEIGVRSWKRNLVAEDCAVG